MICAFNSSVPPKVEEEEEDRFLSVDLESAMDGGSAIRRFLKSAYWYVPTTQSQLYARDAILELLKTPVYLGSLVYLVRMISDFVNMAQARQNVISRARVAGPTVPLDDQAYVFGITRREIFGPEVKAPKLNCCRRNRRPMLRPRNAQEYYMLRSFWQAVDLEFSFRTIWAEDRLFLVGWENWDYDSYVCACHQPGYRISQGLMLVPIDPE